LAAPLRQVIWPEKVKDG
jgi:hypothetical protein